jgi:hypothetical protein
MKKLMIYKFNPAEISVEIKTIRYFVQRIFISVFLYIFTLINKTSGNV